jgi:hypothetical protein
VLFVLADGLLQAVVVEFALVLADTAEGDDYEGENIHVAPNCTQH